MTSSAVQSHAWSILSLNDISIIEVFRLPVTLDDISSLGPDLTFASLFQGPTMEQDMSSSETGSDNAQSPSPAPAMNDETEVVRCMK
jgi:hypothetical protein